MRVTTSALSGLLVVEPRVHHDERGYFLESWNQARYAGLGIGVRLVQDNLSYSRRGVLRGLHFQEPYGQGKLLSVAHGEVFDVAVDIRVGSPTFGQWEGFTLSAENGRQLYVPPGFAHGFQAVSEDALFTYRCTEYYHPRAEHALLWNDPDIGIDWPLKSPLVSEKDRAGRLLREIPPEHLPQFDDAATAGGCGIP